MVPVIVTTYLRTQPTLHRTIESLKNAHFTQITTSHGLGHPRQDWCRAACAILAAQDGCRSVLVVQDDILVARGLASFLEPLTWPSGVGCLSLYCPDKYLDVAQPPGFCAPDQNTWGACALMFPPSVLRQVVESEVYRGWHGDREIDSAIGASLFAMGLEFWYLFPSAVQHVGDVSTLCEFPAAGWRQASSFPGEDRAWDFRLPWE